MLVWRPKEQGTLLGLASGGGQQIPIFSAAGAVVTSFDQSSEQLNKDAQVAQREGLAIECIQGDMADLSVFDDASFDVIFHPVSNIFAADIRPVWQHCARILRPWWPTVERIYESRLLSFLTIGISRMVAH